MFPRQSDSIGIIFVKMGFLAFIIGSILFAFFLEYSSRQIIEIKKSLADFQEPLPPGFKFVDFRGQKGPSMGRGVVARHEPSGITIDFGFYNQPEPAFPNEGESDEHKKNNELTDQKYFAWLKKTMHIDLADSSPTQELIVGGEKMRYIAGHAGGKSVVVGFLPGEFIKAQSPAKDFDLSILKQFLDSIHKLN